MDSYSLQIKNILGIDLALAKKISAICKPVTYTPNTVIQIRGELDSGAIFLLNGVCKYSIFDKNGNEIIFQFTKAESFLAYAFFGFYRKERAAVNFVSVTSIEGLELKLDKLMPIVDNNPHLYGFFLKSIMARFQLMRSKEYNNIQKTNADRYTEFVELHKHVIDDIPLKDIAAYLHIQPGSLSRIRKNIDS